MHMNKSLNYHLKFMNKNNILSGGWRKNLTGGGKWGWGGEGSGREGEGSGVKGGGKWGLGTPPPVHSLIYKLETIKIC